MVSVVRPSAFIGVLLLFAASALPSRAQFSPVALVNQPLVPDTATPGGAAFTLTVNGTGFRKGSVVNWNGSARSTHFVSSSQLMAKISAPDIALAGTAAITVTSPGGISSNVIYFPVATARPLATLEASNVAIQHGGPSVAGDFNGDGKPDIAVSFGFSLLVYLGNGDGTFQPAVESDAVVQGTPLVGDFNRDGKVDVALGYENGFVLYTGNGDGTFNEAGQTLSRTASSFGAADINGDGALDLFLTARYDNFVAVFLGKGNGTFKSEVNYPTGNIPFGVAAGDLNGDGKLDLAVADFNCPGTPCSDGYVSVLLGNGDGTFQGHVDYPVGVTPDAVTLADFNGDGKLDLAVGSGDPSATGSIFVLLGNGDGTLQPQTTWSTGATGNQPLALFTGDFNNDGKLDLISTNSSGNGISVLLGNGDGTFQNPSSFGNAPESTAALADFNGDGRLDIGGNFGNFAYVLMLNSSAIPVATLSQSFLTFPDQTNGTSSAPQSVTLTNSGGATMTISSITVPSGFTETNNCGTSLAALANCTINVTFAPAVPGSFTGTLSIADDASGSPQTVSLTASGTVVRFSPAGLSFGSQTVGTKSVPQNFTLTNVGKSALSISGIACVTDTGAVTKEFRETNNCGSSLPGEASCTITVTFTPKGLFTYNEFVGVQDKGGGSPQLAPISGTGVPANP
jgi:hypothetical protein